MRRVFTILVFLACVVFPATGQANGIQLASTDWSTFTSAQAVMTRFNIGASEILVVQPVIPLSNGMRGDSIEVVMTKNGSDYFYVPSTGSVFNTPPPRFLTGEATFYGREINLYQGSTCSGEYAVVFYVPWCMHETSPGKFGGTPGVVDAWAMGVPPCDASCWGVHQPAAPAWEGACARGDTCWYNYQSCGRWDSARVGKMIQKRWLFGWRHCGWADLTIASGVSARMRY